MKKSTIITLTLVTALGVGGAAVAGPWGGGPGCGRGVERVVSALDLNEKQEDLAYDIAKDLGKRRRALKEASLPDLGAVITELEQPNPNAGKLHDLADAKLEAIAGLVHHTIDRVLELHATMSGEQRANAVKKLRRIEEYARE